MTQLRQLFNVRCLASQVAVSNKAFLLSGARYQSTNQEKKEEVHFMNFEDAEDPEEVAAKEALIEQKRNKSKLFPGDYNRQHDRVPYDKPHIPYHESLRYKRRLYGKHGESSGVEPRILWPSKKEMDAMKEFDDAHQPYTFHELLARLRERKELDEKEKMEREALVLKKVNSIKAEILEFKKRVEAKMIQAQALAEKKNKLIEEGRRRLGYTASFRDLKLKAVIEELEMEEKKKKKAAKKASKVEKRKAKLELLAGGGNKEDSKEDENKEEEK